MRIVVASVIAVTIAAGLAGCGGSGGSATTSDETPSIDKGLSFGNGFVHRLIVVGRWKDIVNDTSPQARKELRDFQKTMKKNGVRTVIGGHGFIRHNCPANPAAGTTSDCISYHLIGGYAIPITGQRVAIKARLRIWLEWIEGRWRLLSYDYDALPRQLPPGA